MGNVLPDSIAGSLPSGQSIPIILKREVYSDLPLVNAILRRIKLAANVDILIKQANSDWTVGRVMFGALVIFSVVAAMSWTWLHSIPAGLGARSCGRKRALYLFTHEARTRDCSSFDAILPDAIDLLGTCTSRRTRGYSGH